MMRVYLIKLYGRTLIGLGVLGTMKRICILAGVRERRW